VVNEPVVALPEREILYARLLELARDEAERAAGDTRADAQYRLQDYTARYLESLLASKQFPKASAIVAGLPQETRQAMRHRLTPIEIRLAAATQQLGSILRREDIDVEQLKQGRRSATASRRRCLCTPPA
jgi:thioredoxin-like negative regulator of GroEL